ncbi:hypothetical protein B0H13DRAFT_1856101 [Mycena leptocephala]|nr:hypothetical protein B0H13DRAFT_1856101 [Mycena leptocephala]
MSQITMPHVTDPSTPSPVTNSAPPAPTPIARPDSTVSIATTEPIEDYLARTDLVQFFDNPVDPIPRLRSLESSNQYRGTSHATWGYGFKFIDWTEEYGGERGVRFGFWCVIGVCTPIYFIFEHMRRVTAHGRPSVPIRATHHHHVPHTSALCSVASGVGDSSAAPLLGPVVGNRGVGGIADSDDPNPYEPTQDDAAARRRVNDAGVSRAVTRAKGCK